MDDNFDLLITGGTVIDGTGSPGRRADVAVVDDRVVAVGDLEGRRAGRRIDASDRIVSPGFVDVHTHDDWAVLLDPDHGCKTLQGVTSIVTGNCGTSPAPPSDVAMGAGGHATMGEYFADLERTPPAVNVATLVGHGSIRSAVIGLREPREATGVEVAQMQSIVEAALQDGAVGMSTGLAYEPGRYAAAAEIEALASVVAAAGGIYTTHMRDEADDLLPSVDEAIAVGEVTRVAVQISHLKAGPKENWGRVVDALAAIDAAARRGVDVMADQYPYTRGSTLLEQVVSAGALDGPSPFGRVDGDQILVAAAPRQPEWEGQTVAEIAMAAGVPWREMADQMVAAAGRSCLVVLDTMSEDDVRTVMAHPRVMIGSDGVPLGSKPHPRLHHTFPRVLGHYSRTLGVLDLHTAVHRMTGLPATRFGLADRGHVTPGAFADLVIFDAANIIDTGTYADPTSVPLGIDAVVVNGRVVAADGAVTGARPGRVLRR